MYMRDVDRGLTYPIGTFRYSKMYPGERYAVFSKKDALVNDPGHFQIYVQINPVDFTDVDPSNNAAIQDFAATSR